MAAPEIKEEQKNNLQLFTELLREGELEQVEQQLEDMHPAEIAEILEDLAEELATDYSTLTRCIHFFQTYNLFWLDFLNWFRNKIMNELNTEIDIYAPPNKVWNLLIDFENYPNWNPYLRHISGPLTIGTKLKVSAHPSGTAGRTFLSIWRFRS